MYLENTLPYLKSANKFFKLEEISEGYTFWNIIPNEILGDSTLKNNEDLNEITNIQNQLENH